MPARVSPAGGPGVLYPQVAEVQRSRMLLAAARAVEELGYTRATVAHITRRARVSRRTFYELFSNRDECLIAALESVLDDIRLEIAAAELDGLAWRERVRGGLWAILSFFDREPVLARFCVVQALRGSQAVLERREEVLEGLALVLDEGREGARGVQCPPLTAQGLVGAVFSLVYARLLRNDSEPLTGLMGDLMGMIVLPYMGPAAARREAARPAPRAAAPVVSRAQGAGVGEEADALAGIPMRLTYRTMRVLEAIADRPGVSNRGVGEQADIADQGQISKLLARLDRLGLIRNTGEGHIKGEANAWTLTETGARVAQTIRTHSQDHKEAA